MAGQRKKNWVVNYQLRIRKLIMKACRVQMLENTCQVHPDHHSLSELNQNDLEEWVTENAETVSNSACNKILQEAGESENAESGSSLVSDCEENMPTSESTWSTVEESIECVIKFAEQNSIFSQLVLRVLFATVS